MTLGYPSVKIHHKVTMYWTIQDYNLQHKVQSAIWLPVHEE